MDGKQKVIEDKIDSYAETSMGKEMIALIALHSRYVVQKWRVNKFIKEFSERLGFKKHIDTAVRVITYLYPRNNREAWKMWDEIYLKRVKKSPWLQTQVK